MQNKVSSAGGPPSLYHKVFNLSSRSAKYKRSRSMATLQDNRKSSTTVASAAAAAADSSDCDSGIDSSASCVRHNGGGDRGSSSSSSTDVIPVRLPVKADHSILVNTNMPPPSAMQSKIPQACSLTSLPSCCDVLPQRVRFDDGLRLSEQSIRSSCRKIFSKTPMSGYVPARNSQSYLTMTAGGQHKRPRCRSEMNVSAVARLSCSRCPPGAQHQIGLARARRALSQQRPDVRRSSSYQGLDNNGVVKDEENQCVRYSKDMISVYARLAAVLPDDGTSNTQPELASTTNDVKLCDSTSLNRNGAVDQFPKSAAIESDGINDSKTGASQSLEPVLLANAVIRKRDSCDIPTANVDVGNDQTDGIHEEVRKLSSITPNHDVSYIRGGQGSVRVFESGKVRTANYLTEGGSSASGLRCPMLLTDVRRQLMDKDLSRPETANQMEVRERSSSCSGKDQSKRTSNLQARSDVRTSQAVYKGSVGDIKRISASRKESSGETGIIQNSISDANKFVHLDLQNGNRDLTAPSTGALSNVANICRGQNQSTQSNQTSQAPYLSPNGNVRTLRTAYAGSMGDVRRHSDAKEVPVSRQSGPSADVDAVHRKYPGSMCDVRRHSTRHSVAGTSEVLAGSLANVRYINDVNVRITSGSCQDDVGSMFHQSTAVRPSEEAIDTSTVSPSICCETNEHPSRRIGGKTQMRSCTSCSGLPQTGNPNPSAAINNSNVNRSDLDIFRGETKKRNLITRFKNSAKSAVLRAFSSEKLSNSKQEPPKNQGFIKTIRNSFRRKKRPRGDDLKKNHEEFGLGHILYFHPDGSQSIEICSDINQQTGPLFSVAKAKHKKGVLVTRIKDSATRRQLTGLLDIGDQLLQVNGKPVSDELNINNFLSEANRITLRIMPSMYIQNI